MSTFRDVILQGQAIYKKKSDEKSDWQLGEERFAIAITSSLADNLAEAMEKNQSEYFVMKIKHAGNLTLKTLTGAAAMVQEWCAYEGYKTKLVPHSHGKDWVGYCFYVVLPSK